MEERITELVDRIDAAGGMYAAARRASHRPSWDSALAFQERVEAGDETIVGVNKYQAEESEEVRHAPLERPAKEAIEVQISRFIPKAARSGRVTAALDALARAADADPSPEQNVFAKAVEAAGAGVTHGEICACLRRQMGFGEPLILT